MRRSHNEIIYETVNFLSAKPESTFHISERLGLHFSFTKQVISELLLGGFVIKCEEPYTSRYGVVYALTERGRLLASKYSELKTLLETPPPVCDFREASGICF